MTTNNLRIWDAVSKTDPKHTKGFKRAGGFQGTAIKPIWLTKRLTEQFGPAGSGWGMHQPEFQTVNAGDEILVFCTVALWYREGEMQAVVYGVGGDKVMGKNKYGPFTNDEAFKASYTDALSNAMKQIGMGADIHMGLFEDEKYVRETTREFANGSPRPTNSSPTDFVDEAKKDGLINGDGSKSQYEVDKLKKAVDNDWIIVNTTPKGKEDQAFAYLEMARNPDDVAKITKNNAATIEGATWQAEFEQSVDNLLRWFEKQSAPALQ